MLLDVRSEFSALNQLIGSKKMPLIYLDSAATTLKPRIVVEAIADFYNKYGGSAGRGSHSLANYADTVIEEVRELVLDFTGADATVYTAIWTSGATESLNMIADLVALEADDKVVLTLAEHHANIIPWQQRVTKVGATIEYLPINQNGEIDFSSTASQQILRDAKVVAITHVSNVTGIVTDIKQLRQQIDQLYTSATRPIIVLDACQSVAHIPLNISELDVDYVALSAHKIYGPTGIGVLIGRTELLDVAPILKTGGGMVEYVEQQSTTFMGLPQKYEPGTVNVANIVGLKAALQFITELGWNNIIAHEEQLTEQLLQVQNIEYVKLLGDNPKRLDNPKHLGLATFVAKGIHSHDLGNYLDEQGVAVRVGHHCAQLIHRAFGINSSLRASVGIYSTPTDIMHLLNSIASGLKFFQKLVH